MDKFRIIIYIDGFNLYYGLKENHWEKYFWLDYIRFFEKFLSDNQALIKVNYFTARPNNPSKAKRQDKLFQVNNENEKFELIFGSYLNKSIYCPKCHETFDVPEEKKTDVNIATHLISDVINNNCDISILVSGDSDLTPPIEFIKRVKPKHIISVFFPPKRQSLHLKNLANNIVYLSNYKQYFKESLFPDEVKLSDGYVIKKPESWV